MTERSHYGMAEAWPFCLLYTAGQGIYVIYVVVQQTLR